MDVLYAFILTALAGISTMVGSFFVFFAKKNLEKFLAVSLGFSAGVMIYVSMIEIFPKAMGYISSSAGEMLGGYLCVIAFFVGIVLVALLDRFLPKVNVYKASSEKNKKKFLQKMSHTGLVKLSVTKSRLILKKTNQNSCKKFFSQSNTEMQETENKNKLFRLGVFTALALIIHNFPEGLATFMSALQDPGIAIVVAIAIAIHNIPEGIAVAMPIYYATGSKRKAFFYSFISGLAEPVGAVVGYLLFLPVMSDLVFGMIFAGVAGMMMLISLDELLPAAREYGKPYLAMYGLICGMFVMALSLLLL